MMINVYITTDQHCLITYIHVHMTRHVLVLCFIIHLLNLSSAISFQNKLHETITAKKIMQVTPTYKCERLHTIIFNNKPTIFIFK